MSATPRRLVALALPVVALLAGSPAVSAASSGSKPAEVVDASKVSQLPVPRFQARPQYPKKLRAAKTGGEALIEFIVDVNGDVRDARAVRATHPEFGAAAVAAVEKWKFKPGVYRGRVVPTRMMVPIIFTLNDEPPAAPAESTGISLEIPTAPEPPDTHDISKVDVKPVPRFQARPQYPFALRRDKVEGEAVTEFIVDTEGNVQRAHAVRATHPAFADAAVAAVSKWKYKPGMKNGRAVNTRMQVPIVFTLNER